MAGVGCPECGETYASILNWYSDTEYTLHCMACEHTWDWDSRE